MNHPGVPVIRQIQQNFITYLRLFAGLPGIRFGDEDVTWFINDNGGSPGNMVLGTQLPAETADQELDRLLHHIGQPAEPIHWLRFPACRPADLGQRLEARGWVSDPGATWMTASLAAFADAPTTPGSFTVQQVVDNAMLEEWKQLSSAGFEMDIQIDHDAYARHGFGPAAVPTPFHRLPGDAVRDIRHAGAERRHCRHLRYLHPTCLPSAWVRQGDHSIYHARGSETWLPHGVVNGI